MKITYLIGNGLDINIDLKTSYSDFYKYLKKNKVNQGNSIVNDITSDFFNTKILEDNDKSDKEKIDWSDFEIAIGKYARKIKLEEKDREKFIAEYEDFIEYFTEYIEENVKTFSIEKLIDENLQQFDNSMRNPINTYERDQEHLTSKFSQFNNSSKSLNYIIFNYTTIFDELLEKWRTHYSQDRFTSNNPIHIHGYCQEEILLGVNDSSQINHEFSSHTDIQMMMVKTIANDYSLTSRKEQTEKIIKTSNLIIIYGMSLGDSDKYWWEVIIESLKKDRNRSILIYGYETEPEKLKKHTRRMQKKQKEWKDKLLQYANPEDRENLSAQIFIQFNTKNIFNFSSIKKEENILV